MEQYTYLAHHGIKGQKWGVRRFQNNDGSLTDQGKRRYLSDETKRKIKTAAKVAAGVAGAAAVGYGVYKVGRAGHRLKMATAYKEASRLSVQSYQHVRNASKYTKTGLSYMRQAGNLRRRASQLKYYGKKSDQLAYKFVESLIKDPLVDWEIVQKAMG